jgi:moderate conductance mechanosensitive channel
MALAQLLAGDGLALFLLRVALTLLVLGVLARLLSWAVWRFVIQGRGIRRGRVSERRGMTLRQLFSSTLNGLVFGVVALQVLGEFVPATALATTLGLFSAGLGFGALPYIKDWLGGVVLLFEDQFAIGDKVELGDARPVIGVVERVSLRTTQVRGEAGELWIVPNGDIRTIRNFTRGSFSPANIRLTVPTAKLDLALAALLDVLTEPGPDVLEPPELISEEGEIGARTTLLIRIKAEHGHAPAVRRRMLTRIQAALAEAGVLE